MRTLSYLLQLVGTLALFATVPGSGTKVFTLVPWWILTFRRLTPREAAATLMVCAMFTIMDLVSIHRGTFRFTHADLFGMPLYEPLMWGFYFMNAWRALRAAPRKGQLKIPLLLTVGFAAAFALVSDPNVLLLACLAILGLGLAIYHEAGDFAYVGYMILMGTLVEYTGVWSGEWSYPSPPAGGVPFWSFALWGGVGLWLRRLVIPFIAQNNGCSESRARYGGADKQPSDR